MIVLIILGNTLCSLFFKKVMISSIIHMEVSMSNPKYKRVVLKLSGEALAGDQGFGIYPLLLNPLLHK